MAAAVELGAVPMEPMMSDADMPQESGLPEALDATMGADGDAPATEEPTAPSTAAAGDDGEDVAEVAAAMESAPARPKRAMSAWGHFLAAEHANRVSQKAGEEWKALTEERRNEYVRRSAADKERYDEEKAAFVAWCTANPEAAARLEEANASARGAADDALEPGVPYLPLSRLRRLTRLAGAKSVSKEGIFVVSKCAEQLVQMLAEQTALNARRTKRKGVNQTDVAAVLYGARCADLLQFLHMDMPQSKLMAEATAKPRQKKPRPAAADGAAVDGDDGVGGDGGDGADGADGGAAERPATAAKRAKRGAAAVAELPVQSTTMRNFFEARPLGEPAPPPPASAARGEPRAAAVQEGEEGEEEEEADEDGEMEDDDELAAAAAAATRRPPTAALRKRRVIMDDDDDDDDDEEDEEEEEEEDEEDEEEDEEAEGGDGNEAAGAVEGDDDDDEIDEA